jgi:murein DD-endopeptidase MepM/ murein hydrolase activator NlpD
MLMMFVSVATYHFIFLQAARDGWPVVSQIVRWVVRDQTAQRERFMRENLDAMAAKVGEMQAKLVKLESMGDRVSGMVGAKADVSKPLRSVNGGGKGGPFVPLTRPSLSQLTLAVEGLDEAAEQNLDRLTLIESQLLESRLRSLMVPNSRPIDGPVGSGFGFRTDPFSGRAALHTGLDFPADVGTPIEAAAGGVVLAVERHPQYGLLVEMDHGNGLTTRYAHLSQATVNTGDIVNRGQTIAKVGSSGRSTGPHLHFEVLLLGVPQNPAKFLAGGAAQGVTVQALARR